LVQILPGDPGSSEIRPFLSSRYREVNSHEGFMACFREKFEEKMTVVFSFLMFSPVPRFGDRWPEPHYY
jgi:hypothetical protein